MLPWERSQQKIESPAALEELFTPQQLNSLITMHARSRTLRIAESGLDPNRIQFVCWLVEHGKLSEDMETAPRDPASRESTGGLCLDGRGQRVPPVEEVA